MAMTEHRGIGTVMGYFQAGSLLTSRAAELLMARLPNTDREAVPQLHEGEALGIPRASTR